MFIWLIWSPKLTYYTFEVGEWRVRCQTRPLRQNWGRATVRYLGQVGTQARIQYHTHLQAHLPARSPCLYQGLLGPPLQFKIGNEFLSMGSQKRNLPWFLLNLQYHIYHALCILRLMYFEVQYRTYYWLIIIFAFIFKKKLFTYWIECLNCLIKKKLITKCC